jgi:hypothetical protein
MGGMTQVKLISNLAAKEIYNDALEKLRVLVFAEMPLLHTTNNARQSPSSLRDRMGCA